MKRYRIYAWNGYNRYVVADYDNESDAQCFLLHRSWNTATRKVINKIFEYDTDFDDRIVLGELSIVNSATLRSRDVQRNRIRHCKQRRARHFRMFDNCRT